MKFTTKHLKTEVETGFKHPCNNTCVSITLLYRRLVLFLTIYE